MSRPAGLSKSRITLFEQCPKRLWLSVHRPELAEEGASVRSAFAAGHRVGELACSLYPGGILIGSDHGLGRAIEDTAAVLGDGRPVFEATFARDGVLVRVDLMLPTSGGWHVAEVKNTTGVKDYHVGDIATQLWVLEGAGVAVTAASIRHLDRAFVLSEPGNYHGLFTDTFVDALAAPVVARRGEVVAAAREVLAGGEPALAMGDHCDAPFPCSFKAWCGRDLPPPPDWPVTLLPGTTGKKTARRWLERGVDDLLQVPAAEMPDAKLARVHHVTLSGETWHDRDAIARETGDWASPRVFLDFETIQFAVPRWVGTRPFQQVPFQFSAHVEQEGDTVEHREYLSLDGLDPRRGCAEALCQLPASGAVIAWNASFERQCLLGLAEEFPDFAAALRDLAARLVDLLPVARRHYYHRDMRGSWSIKAVLPTLAPTGYEDLDGVKSGTDAQAGYLEAIDPATPAERVEALRRSLLDYCRRDTEAMMIVLEALTRPAGAAGDAGC